MANLAPIQVEQLQKIGSYLRQLRQDQGLSLDFVANQTFIRPVLLQAIETGRYEDLPQPIFIQGFIRRYADSLGIDGKTLSQEFSLAPPDLNPLHDLLIHDGEARDGTGHGAPPPVDTPVPVQPPPSPSPDPVSPAPVRPPKQSPSQFGRRSPLFLSLGLAVLLLGGGWVLWKTWGGSPQSVSSAVSKETPPLPASQPASTPSTTAAPTPPPRPVAPVVVQVTLGDRSWLTITADGKSLYEGMAQKGYLKTWTAQKSLMVRAGNAGAVSLTINGDRETIMGKPGAVKTLTLTPGSTAAAIQSP
ncbi:MAG: helix-turn-helix domain-containing protein [Nodosilinea sp.]